MPHSWQRGLWALLLALLPAWILWLVFQAMSTQPCALWWGHTRISWVWHLLFIGTPISVALLLLVLLGPRLWRGRRANALTARVGSSPGAVLAWLASMGFLLGMAVLGGRLASHAAQAFPCAT